MQIESTPPYGQSLATRSSRLATRTSGKRLENAEKAAAEKSGGKVATAKAQHRPGSEATNKEDDVKRRETAAAGKLRLAKQFLEKKQFGDARKWLKGVISDYPGTAAAKEAADLMESIK